MEPMSISIVSIGHNQKDGVIFARVRAVSPYRIKKFFTAEIEIFLTLTVLPDERDIDLQNRVRSEALRYLGEPDNDQ